MTLVKKSTFTPSTSHDAVSSSSSSSSCIGSSTQSSPSNSSDHKSSSGNGSNNSNSSSIQVAVRIRPFLPIESGSTSCVDVLDSSSSRAVVGGIQQRQEEQVGTVVRISSTSSSSSNHNHNHKSSTNNNAAAEQSFTFDHALPSTASQSTLYTRCVSPLIASCLDGYNATTLAYGQTGAGKTYTMLGPGASAAWHDDTANEGENEEEESGKKNSNNSCVGILPRALRDIFKRLEDKKMRVGAVDTMGDDPDPAAAVVVAAANHNGDDDDDDDNEEARVKNTPDKERETREDAATTETTTATTTANSMFEYKVKLQFLELYGEEIRDLLSPSSSPASASAASSSSSPHCTKLHIRDLPSDSEVVGATELGVKSADEALLCFTKGMLKRVTGATNMNAESSRSHAIMSVIVEQKTKRRRRRKATMGGENGEGMDVSLSSAEEEEEEEVKKSKFNFVDLAGSERQKRTGAKGKRLKEGIDINKGLLVLGNVISALGDPTKKSKFVPFRDSKLTRLLRGSIGGNHKTLMIACVSPSMKNLDESWNCLRYANRARNIKNRPVLNMDGDSRIIAELRALTKGLAVELLRVRSGEKPNDDKFSMEMLQSLGGVSGSKGGNSLSLPYSSVAGLKPLEGKSVAPHKKESEPGELSGSSPKEEPSVSGGEEGRKMEATEVSETYSTLDNEEIERLRASLQKAEQELAAKSQKLDEIQAERDNIENQLRSQREEPMDSPKEDTSPDKDIIAAIVEHIASYDDDRNKSTLGRRWSSWYDTDRSVEDATECTEDTMSLSSPSSTFDGESSTSMVDSNHPLAAPPEEPAPVSPETEVASVLYSVGLFLADHESYEDATPCLRAALQIRREVYGWDDPSVGDVMHTEGTIGSKTGDHDRALLLLYDALRIRKMSADSMKVSATLRAIGDLHVAKNELIHADIFYQESLEEQKKNHGYNDESLPEVLIDLAKVKTQLGEHAAAMKCYEEALDVQTMRLGPNHPLVGTLYNEMGKLAFQMGDCDYGERSLQEFIKIRKHNGWEVDAEVANVFFTLGNLYAAKYHPESARYYWTEALQIYHFIGLPDAHPCFVALQEKIKNLADPSRKGERRQRRKLFSRRNQRSDSWSCSHADDGSKTKAPITEAFSMKNQLRSEQKMES